MLFNKKNRLFYYCSTFYKKISKYNEFQDELENVAHVGVPVGYEQVGASAGVRGSDAQYSALGP